MAKPDLYLYPAGFFDGERLTFDDLDANVFYGDAERPLPDWREEPGDDDDDAYDNLTPQQRAGLVAVLGFDPSESEVDPIVLSDEGRAQFFAALDNPPPPNEALKKLMAVVRG